MKISVIIPAYNASKYLDKCLESVLSQTYRDFEIILIDDGSTDGTREICDRFLKQDNRVRVYPINHSGISAVRNLGLEKANGEWVTFVDADDTILPNCYEEAMKHIDKADIIQWNFYRKQGNKEIIKPEYISASQLYDITTENKYPHYFRVVWDKLYKKDIIDRYELRFKNVLKSEDIIFNLNVYPYFKKVYVLDNKLSVHNLIPNSLSQVEESIQDIQDKLLALNEVKSSLQKDNLYKLVESRIERRISWVKNDDANRLSDFYQINLEKPVLSIIMPVYNSELTLEKCLSSIQTQTLTNWECIIVDDGSIDNTKTILDYWSWKDQRFKIIHKKNEGPAVARNIGLKLAIGEWIGFVDSDDWIEKNRFEKAIVSAMSYKVDIVQCAINVYKNDTISKVWHLGEPGIYSLEDGRIYSAPLYDIGHCWDKVYKAELLKNNSILFAQCDMCEDTLFNAKAYLCSGKILSIDDKLYNYSMVQGSLSHSDISSERRVGLIYAFDRYLKELEIQENFKYIKDVLKKLLSSVLDRGNKIDYVFPYVDNNDPIWQKAYNKAKGIEEDETTNGVERFRSGEELLKYKFRAIEKWMPWIGTIHMIVSNIEQVPKWIDQSKVHIVLHKDIIPAEYLPTFNSCTIEMFIHNIFGLSERFIYSNDDCYPNDVLKPSFYFTAENKIKSDFHNRKLWHEGDINKVWAQIPINSLKLVSSDAPSYAEKYIDGVHLYELQHIGRPMIKSMNELVFNKYREEIMTSISQFRDIKNYNQSIFTAYCLFHNKGSFETFRHGFYSIGNDTNKIINDIKGNATLKSRAICCNDSEIAMSEDFSRIEQAFAQEYPNKSIYEVK